MIPSVLLPILLALASSFSEFAGQLSPVPGAGDERNRPASPPVISLSDTTGPYVQGENLLYEVSWSIFKIGTIRLRTLPPKKESSLTLYPAQADIDSYDLPFVNVHAVNYTEMDSAFVSRGARSLEKKNDYWWGIQYIPDPARGYIVVRETWQKEFKSQPFKEDTLDTIHVDLGRIEDSFALAYYARSRVRSRTVANVPVLANGKLGHCHIWFDDSRSTQEIDAVHGPIRVVELDGRLDLEGIFGLTGDFQGWFSDDSAAVPIKASMKVILGSVTIELKEWKRQGWSPPLALD